MMEHNIPVIGMSGNPDSLLAKYATAHLNSAVSREACPLGLAPTSSTTAALALGDALACALMVARNFKATDFAQYHPGGTLGKRLLTRAKDVMRTEDPRDEARRGSHTREQRKARTVCGNGQRPGCGHHHRRRHPPRDGEFAGQVLPAQDGRHNDAHAEDGFARNEGYGNRGYHAQEQDPLRIGGRRGEASAGSGGFVPHNDLIPLCSHADSHNTFMQDSA